MQHYSNLGPAVNRQPVFPPEGLVEQRNHVEADVSKAKHVQFQNFEKNVRHENIAFVIKSNREHVRVKEMHIQDK